MDKYKVAQVERKTLCQELVLNGIGAKAGVVKKTTVSAWMPLVSLGCDFTVYNYWRDEKAMVARVYKVDGKTHIDLIGGCSDADIHAVYKMLGLADVCVFSGQVVQALRERGVRSCGEGHADLKRLMELQYADSQRFQGR